MVCSLLSLLVLVLPTPLSLCVFSNCFNLIVHFPEALRVRTQPRDWARLFRRHACLYRLFFDSPQNSIGYHFWGDRIRHKRKRAGVVFLL
jgi:hypothetical protein